MPHELSLDLEDDFFEDDDEAFFEDDDDEAFFEDDDEEEAFGEDDDEMAERRRRRRSSRFRRNFRRGVPRLRQSLTSRRGVQSATLRTPQGNAQLRLSSAVPSLVQFNKAVASLKSAHNKLAKQVTANRSAIRTNATAAARATATLRRDLAKQAKDAKQAQMMSMLMSMMMSQQNSTAIASHHGGASTNNAMMLLPLMMMGGSGGSGDSSMMMVMMMMAMQQQQQRTGATA